MIRELFGTEKSGLWFFQELTELAFGAPWAPKKDVGVFRIDLERIGIVTLHMAELRSGTSSAHSALRHIPGTLLMLDKDQHVNERMKRSMEGEELQFLSSLRHMSPTRRRCGWWCGVVETTSRLSNLCLLHICFKYTTLLRPNIPIGSQQAHFKVRSKASVAKNEVFRR